MAGEDRGDYRPIFVALVHGPDFLALSKWARALWYPVKLALGPLGIRPIPGAIEAFAEYTAFEPAEVERARDELIATGWIKVEGNVWWLVRGLEFEPQLNQADPKHCKFVVREWQKLPNLSIRAEFRLRHASWFGEVPPSPARGIEGPPKALSSTIPIPAPIQPPAPPPSPTTGAAGQRPSVRMAVAANAGLAANPLLKGEYRELVPSQAEKHATDWLAAGLDLDLICQTIERVSQAYKPTATSPQPVSFTYFDKPIRQAHERLADTKDLNGTKPKTPRVRDIA